jgi:hypothetical protein
VPLTRYPLDTATIYKSSWLKYALFFLAEDWFIDKKQEKVFEHIGQLIQKDWSALSIDACVYTWLCVEEEERLEKLYPNHKNMPDDVSYGLVLQHYEPVMRMACFLAGFTYSEEREMFDKELLEDAHNYALADAIEKMAGIVSQDKVQEIVSTITM